MAFSFVILGIGAILVTLFLIDKIHKYSVRETLIKASASVMFISLAVYHNFLKGFTPFGSLVIVALVLGLLGDVWLDLKYVFPEEDKAFTYAGFVCFGLGHIAFMSGMFIEFYVPGNILYIILPYVFGLLMGVVTVFLEKPMKLVYGGMKLIVFLYGILLFSMLGVSFSLYVQSGFKSVTLLLMSFGAMLFAISDLVLSGTYFGKGKERAIDISINGILYYIAQFSIAFSIYFIGTNLF